MFKKGSKMLLMNFEADIAWSPFSLTYLQHLQNTAIPVYLDTIYG